MTRFFLSNFATCIGLRKAIFRTNAGGFPLITSSFSVSLCTIRAPTTHLSQISVDPSPRSGVVSPGRVAMNIPFVGKMGKKPKSLCCYLCGREYGTSSLQIHLTQCQKV